MKCKYCERLWEFDGPCDACKAESENIERENERAHYFDQTGHEMPTNVMKKEKTNDHNRTE